MVKNHQFRLSILPPNFATPKWGRVQGGWRNIMAIPLLHHAPPPPTPQELKGGKSLQSDKIGNTFPKGPRAPKRKMGRPASKVGDAKKQAGRIPLALLNDTTYYFCA